MSVECKRIVGTEAVTRELLKEVTGGAGHQETCVPKELKDYFKHRAKPEEIGHGMM